MTEPSTIVGIILVILGSVGFLVNLFVLIGYIRQRRQSTNLNKIVNSKKVQTDVSQYFLFSTWLCFTTNLTLSIGHDGPTLIVGRPIFGHTVSGVCGWFSRWMFYALAGHLILITGNRYTILSRGSLTKHKIFGTKIGLRFATFIIWAPAATVATIVKLRVCEFQFVVESLAHICIETISDRKRRRDNGDDDDSSTLIKYDDLKTLLIVDSSILSFVYLFIIICIWRLFSSLKQRQIRVTQADSVLSIEKQKKKTEVGKMVVMVNERNQIRQLIISSFVYFAVSFCYLIIYWFAETKWLYLINTSIQIIYWSFYPTLYLILTNQLRNLIPCLKQPMDNVSDTSSLSWQISPSNTNFVNGFHMNEKSAFSQVYSSKTPSPIFSNASHTDSMTFTSPMSLDVMNLYQCHQDKRNRKPVLFSSDSINRSQHYQKGKTIENSRMTMIQARASTVEPTRLSPNNDINTKERSRSPFYERLSRSRLPPIKLNAFERQASTSCDSATPPTLTETEKKRRRWLFMVANNNGSVDSSADSVAQLGNIWEKRQHQKETMSLQNCENDGSLQERLDAYTTVYAAKNSTYQTSLAALTESNCSSVCSVEENEAFHGSKLSSTSALIHHPHHHQTSPSRRVSDTEEVTNV